MITDFNLDVLNEQRMFYMVQKDSSVLDFDAMHWKTPTGLEAVEGYQLHRMQNNMVLISFAKELANHSKYNLVIEGKYSSADNEIVPLQFFQRIEHFYNVSVDNTDGGFMFYKSEAVEVPATPWRCDYQMYGPNRFFPANQTGAFFSDINQIVTYEPIISVNSVGHLVFLHLRDDAEISEEVFNNDYYPSSARTLSECVKQIIEWSDVSKAPFNNSEPIAVAASQFLVDAGFDDELCDLVRQNQVPMQVAQFLMGSTTARRRPSGVQPLFSELDQFIRRNVSNLSLTAILDLYPDAWNRQEVLERELEVMVLQEEQLVRYLDKDPKFFGLHNIDALTTDCVQRVRGGAILKVMADYLARKKEYLTSQSS